MLWFVQYDLVKIRTRDLYNLIRIVFVIISCEKMLSKLMYFNVSEFLSFSSILMQNLLWKNK